MTVKKQAKEKQETGDFVFSPRSKSINSLVLWLYLPTYNEYDNIEE